MVEIGGRPILWHILKIYSAHGINDFIICAGYKGYVIKEYFANYFLHMSDVTFDMSRNSMEVHSRNAEPWRVTVVDTGEETMTGGRLARVRPYLNDQTFCFTYGDGVADINITELVKFHRSSNRLATLTAVQPRDAMVPLGLTLMTLTQSHRSKRNRKEMVHGSTGATLCLNQRRSTTSKTVIQRSGNVSLSQNSRVQANFPRIDTAAFGDRWIR